MSLVSCLSAIQLLFVCPLYSDSDISSIEFIPYIFQILAQLLESSPADSVSDNYRQLLGPLLQPTLWETRGNIPACTRLLSALIPRVAKTVVAENHLEAVLGIFQRLLNGKKSELNAFDVLDSVINSFEP